jgi:hypothetical protein
MCGRLDEDSGHLFFKCKFVKQVWRQVHLEGVRARASLAEQSSAHDVMETIFSLKEESKLKVVVTRWCRWSAHNKANQGERKAFRPPLMKYVIQ